MRQDLACAVDLGTSKVACVAAGLDDRGRLRVEGAASVAHAGLNRGAVTDPDLTGKAVDEAVARVERTVGRGFDSLVTNVSGPHLRSLFGQGIVHIVPAGRPIRREDELQVVTHSRQAFVPSGHEQVLAVPREFRVDDQAGLNRATARTGARLEVTTLIVTGASQVLHSIERAVTLSGRSVEQMVPAGIATGLALATQEELDKGCVVIDIGSASTEVATFSLGAPECHVSLPVGSNHVTTDIQALLKTSLESAERLKLDHGAAMARLVPEGEVVEVSQMGSPEPRPMQRRVLCEIVESRMREIAQLAHRALEQSGATAGIKGTVVLTGGGSLLAGARDLFAEVFGSEARLGSAKVGGSGARLVESPAMSAAVGLAHVALQGDDQEFAPVSGFANWKEKIRSLRSYFGTAK
jgi:cell division protein FtsA